MAEKAKRISNTKRFSARETRRVYPLSWNLLIVVLAFALMVVSSILFVNSMLKNHLNREETSMLEQTELEIKSMFVEPQTTLNIIAETIRTMILRGAGEDDVLEYLKAMSQKLQTQTQGIASGPVYGYFEAFGNTFLHGEELAPQAGYKPTKRLWYDVTTSATPTFSPLYTDMRAGLSAMACALRIFDDNGLPLGTVYMDICIDQIKESVRNMRLSPNGCGFLLNENLEVIASTHANFTGMPMHAISGGLAALEACMKKGADFYETEGINYAGESSVYFSIRMEYGWYLILMTPKNEYYKELSDMERVLGALGTILAIVLCVILAGIDAAKEHADELKRKADQANRQKSDFLATMSHEIRSPMNVILGIAEMEMESNAITQEVKESFGKIYNSGNTLIHIINDLLDLSKIEANKFELMPAKYEVASLINDTVYLNMLRFESKPIAFTLHVDENVPANVTGDELRIKQILNNILSNAFKYTERGEIELTVTAETPAQEEDGNVILVFRVRDTGQGMTEEQVSRLFDKYARFNLKVNRVVEGAGLGMYITRNLVRLMNGQILVESKPNKGSTFTVRLPQKNASANVFGKELAENMRQLRFTSGAQVRKAQIVRTPMPYGSVLVVDDTTANLDVAKLLLSPYGLHIDIANSGFEAIDKVKKGKRYDIVFMDHMMPKMDGIEATKYMREIGYTDPIVALTANALVGQAEIFLKNGFDAFISKPIDIRHLNAVLNKMVRDKHFPKDGNQQL
ncbi:MAG: ATP-binding protein [Firmicutes bacterium]|nr:ATP-binding protein [Bacillota bacterium]